MTIDTHEIFVIIYRVVCMMLFSIAMDSLCSVLLTPRLGSPNSHLFGRLSWFLMLVFIAVFSSAVRVDMLCLVSAVIYAAMPFIAYKGRACLKILTMDVMLNMLCIHECFFLCYMSVKGLELVELNKKLFVWNDHLFSNIFDISNIIMILLGVPFLRKTKIVRINMPEVKHWEGALWSIVSNMLIYTALLLAGHGMVGKNEGNLTVAVFVPMAVIAFGLQLSYINNSIHTARELEKIKKHYDKLESELSENKDKQRRANEIYRIEHDMKNHLTVVEMLNMSNDYERIEEYASGLLNQVESGEFVKHAQWNEE